MSELAINIKGEEFEVPAGATAWRVRRMKQKGGLEVVYGRDGSPLVLPLEANFEDIKSEVDVSGRYRLDLIDKRSKLISSAQPAYVYVKVDAPTNDRIVVEAMRTSSEITRKLIERLPEMVEAAAALLRAADGARLVTREPRRFREEEFEADTDELDLSAMVAEYARAPGRMTMLRQPFDRVPANANEVVPPIDPAVMAHFIAVHNALAPEEAAVAREVATKFTAIELRSWFEELSKLTVAQAVQKIRVLVAGNTEAVS